MNVLPVIGIILAFIGGLLFLATLIFYGDHALRKGTKTKNLKNNNNEQQTKTQRNK